MNVSKLISLVPEVLISTDDSDLAEALKFYQGDLVCSDMIDVELVRWRCRWARVQNEFPQGSGIDALRNCETQ